MQKRSACPSGDYLSVGFSLNRGCTSFTPTWWRPPLPRRDLADRAGSDCQVSLMGIIGIIKGIIIIIKVIILMIINGTRGIRLSNISGGHNAPHCGRRRWSGTSLNYLLLCATRWCYNPCYNAFSTDTAGALTTYCKVYNIKTHCKHIRHVKTKLQTSRTAGTHLVRSPLPSQ